MTRPTLRAIDSLAADVEGSAPEQVVGPIRRRLTVLTDEEMECRPKPAQIVKGMLLEKSTSAIVGEPGVGKGPIAIDLLYRIGLGLDYHGHPTAAGTCVYIAMERQGGLGARIRAWKQRYQRPGPAPVLFIPERFSLFDPNGATRLLDELRDESLFPPPIQLIAIDTFAKAMLPGNENETHDMGTLMSNLHTIAETGPNVLSIHHLNASGTRERGNTSFRGDVDTLILVEKQSRGVKLRCEKQNELEEFPDISLSITREGESAVVETSDGGSSPMLRPEHLECLRALDKAALSGEASSTAWKDAHSKSPSTFYDHSSYLLRHGYVAKGEGKRGRFSLTLTGRWAITPISDKPPTNLRPELDTDNLRTSGGLNEPPGSQFRSRDACGDSRQVAGTAQRPAPLGCLGAARGGLCRGARRSTAARRRLARQRDVQRGIDDRRIFGR